MNTIDIDNLPECVSATVPKASTVPYTIYNLNDKFDTNSSDSNTTNNIFRSVIVGDGKLLCIAPSKSVSNDQFTASHDVEAFLRKEEIIEGTMINLFWDARVGWEIATKKSIGCNYFFFRNQYDGQQSAEQKTFRQMFLDAFIQKVDNLADLDLLKQLDKSCSYTFVLQHPLNHIVLHIDKPTVYLVHMYKFIGGMNYQFAQDCGELRQDFLDAGVKFPNQSSESSNLIPGYMITNLKTGLRTVINNDKYQDLKTLRGNNPNLFFHYLMLRKTNDVDRFLTHFPQYMSLFQGFQTKFKTFVSRIYQLYVDVHITKSVKLENKQDLFFVEKLHYTVFLPSLKTNMRVKISPKIVEELLDSKEYMMPLR
jgi:hypothetical protein